ncbi:MAG: hypothetical protein PF638_10495 [Candidatus Delongbacteria bacterium]|jgi:hypothetical protein|nr:hypothetical protein [Candidatus Delongbacteria bacterium]
MEKITNIQYEECSHTTCEYEVYEKDKCILHCDKNEKNGWYELQNGKKIWNQKKVDDFWNAIREEITNLDKVNHVTDYIFPEFEKYIKQIVPNKDTLSKNYNFWVKGVGVNDLEINEISFRDCVFLGKTRFNHMNIGRLSFYSCSFSEDLTLSRSNFNKVYFDRCKVNGRMFIVHSEFSKSDPSLKLYDVEFNKRLVIRNIQNNNINISLNLCHFYENSIVDITYVGAKYFKLKDIYNYSKTFQIRDIEIQNEFIIEGTSINSLIFIDCNFAKTKKLALKSMSLQNIIFDNINWGKINSDHIDANRDAIRQLKHSNDLQGNYIQANKFYALEMEKYGEEIKDSKNYLEKAIFLISKNLSNFSQNWLLPIFWFIFLYSFLFDFLILKNNAFDFNTSSVFISISILLSKIALASKIITSNTRKWLFITVFIIAAQVTIFSIINWDGNLFNEYFWLFNPFNTKTEGDSDMYEKIVFIIYKLFTILVGYHLVTALRFHTRRK